MIRQGVIEKETGDLLRWGHCDFRKDGRLNSRKEKVVTALPPEPCIRRPGDPFQPQYHRWDGMRWRRVKQKPEGWIPKPASKKKKTSKKKPARKKSSQKRASKKKPATKKRSKKAAKKKR